MNKPIPALSSASQAALESPQIAQLALPAGSMPKPGMTFNLLIVGFLVDNSISIGDGTPQWRSLVDAHNGIVNALLESKFADRTLFYTRLLDGTVVNDFARAKGVVMLGDDNFRCTLGRTPLTQQTQIIVGAMFRMADALRNGGSSVRMSLMLVTDGGENVRVSSEMQTSTVSLIEDWETGGNGVTGIGITGPEFTEEECFATFERLGVKRRFPAGDPAAMEALAADFAKETLALMSGPGA